MITRLVINEYSIVLCSDISYALLPTLQIDRDIFQFQIKRIAEKRHLLAGTTLLFLQSFFLSFFTTDIELTIADSWRLGFGEPVALSAR